MSGMNYTITNKGRQTLPVTIDGKTYHMVPGDRIESDKHPLNSEALRKKGLIVKPVRPEPTPPATTPAPRRRRKRSTKPPETTSAPAPSEDSASEE